MAYKHIPLISGIADTTDATVLKSQPGQVETCKDMILIRLSPMQHNWLHDKIIPTTVRPPLIEAQG
jgi:hypothetical protein